MKNGGEKQIFKGLFVKYLYLNGWLYMMNENISKKWSFLSHVPTYIGLTISLLYSVSQIISMLYKSFDLASASEIICLLISCLAVQIKICTVLFQLNEFAKLLVIFQVNLFKFNSKKGRIRADSIMNVSVKKANRCTLLFILVIIIIQIVWQLATFIPHSQKQNQTLAGTDKLLPGWYPWNYTHPPGSLIAFIYELLLALFCGFYTMSSNIFFYQLTLLLCGYIDVLADSFKNINKQYRFDKLMTNTGEGRLVYYEQRNLIVSSLSSQIEHENNKNIQLLIAAIKNHQITIRLAKKLSSVYSIFVAVDILSTLFLICLLLFQMTSVPEKRSIHDLLKLGTYLLGSCTMLFMVCWIGSELQNKSSKLNESIYMGDWYCSSVAYRKILSTVMLVSQQQLSLTAGHTYHANLRLFTKVMRVAYSFYTVLVNVYKNK